MKEGILDESEALLINRRMQWTVVLFQFLLLRSTSAVSVSNQLPTFTWLQNDDQPDQIADPLLKVGFPDGGQDVIRFHKVHRYYDDLDECIMSGAFENEPNVIVTLTGGCHNSEDFEMTIVGSQRLGHSTFKVTQGAVDATDENTGRDSTGDRHDAFPLPGFESRDELPGKKINRAKKVPYNAWVKLELHADDDFRYNFNNDDRLVQLNMNKIVGHAQTWFSEKNMGYPEIILNPSISPFWMYKGSVYPDAVNLKRTSDAVNNARDANQTEDGIHVKDMVMVFFGIQGTFQQIGGIAFPETICTNSSYNTAIVEHWNKFSVTGLYLAHEISLALGIRNDFDENTGYYYNDKSGQSCYTAGSLMGKRSSRTTWSKCSIESLKDRFQNGHLDCLKMNFND